MIQWTPTLLLFAASATLSTASAQSKTPKNLAVSGTATGYWVTSMGKSPIAKGEFRMQFQGEKAWLRIELPAVGVIVHGFDGKRSWAIDPEAGPVFRKDLAAKSDAQMFSLLRGDVRAAEAQYAGDAESKQANWKFSDDHLATVKFDNQTAIGEAAVRTLEFHDWSDRDGHAYPAMISIEQGHRRIDLEVVDYSTKATAIDAARFALSPELTKIAEKFGAKGQTKDALSCELVDVAEQPVAYMRATVAMNDISKELGRMLPKIMMHVVQSGTATAGAPYSRYHSFDGKHFDLECGIPVEKVVVPGNGVRAGSLPAGRAATTWHIGAYQELGKSHERLTKWLQGEGMVVDGGLWEIYWTDPGLERNPAKWRTQLVQPVKKGKGADKK